SDEEWNARQELFSQTENAKGNFAVAKFATLPAEIAATVEMIDTVADSALRKAVVAQATGIGWVRIDGAASEIAAAMRRLREWLESRQGSLVIVRRAAGMPELDAWGNSGDALGLMRAVKMQFDAQGTLNPGRFVG